MSPIPRCPGEAGDVAVYSVVSVYFSVLVCVCVPQKWAVTEETSARVMSRGG